MIEILIILGVVALIIWAIWNYTDISSRIAQTGKHFDVYSAFNPQKQRELDKLNEADICSMEGVKTVYTPFEPTNRLAPIPIPENPSLDVPLGTFDLPNRVENEGLGYECISDMPFLLTYPEQYGFMYAESMKKKVV